MPRKSGLLLYRQLESDAAFKDIPVVVVTGLTRSDRTTETFIHTFLEADHMPPPQAYLEKPLDNETLLREVRRAMAHRESQPGTAND